MKYFAMISGQQKGPFQLECLAEAGVTPSTYVWCKGMPDWMQASEVPDICRYFRQRLAGINPSAPQETQQQTPDSKESNGSSLFFYSKEFRNLQSQTQNGEEQHHSKALPIVLFILFFLVIIFGFFLRYLL